ncbi:MAG TPA: septum formation initiator family protein, partial [Dehalococcoidia bacterium]|nr:septum formation initiator family protein [Dehalococcoidia bacterium]
ALLTGTTIALLQVDQSSSFAHTGQTLQELEKERSQLTAQIHQLEADVAALSSLDRTERAARERLGMVPAPRTDYLSVGVEAPDGALLPRPILSAYATHGPSADPWWQIILQSLPFR